MFAVRFTTQILLIALKPTKSIAKFEEKVLFKALRVFFNIGKSTMLSR